MFILWRQRNAAMGAHRRAYELDVGQATQHSQARTDGRRHIAAETGDRRQRSQPHTR